MLLSKKICIDTTVRMVRTVCRAASEHRVLRYDVFCHSMLPSEKLAPRVRAVA